MSDRAFRNVVAAFVAVSLGATLAMVVDRFDRPPPASRAGHRVPSSTADGLIPPLSILPPSTTSMITTTTTTSAPTTTTRPSPPVRAASAGPAVAAGSLRSTAYCLTGGMASGRPTYVGAVAANRYALGTRLRAWPNPWGDPAMIFTVEDRHKPGATELDFAMPRECERALAWGNRRFVTVEIVP